MQAMKIISKRPMKKDAIKDSEFLQKTFNLLRKNALVPKGVYHFKTEKEADRWMTEQMANTHARLNPKT